MANEKTRRKYGDRTQGLCWRHNGGVCYFHPCVMADNTELKIIRAILLAAAIVSGLAIGIVYLVCNY